MSSKKAVKIFLASSSELKEDRDNFEIDIRRKYEIWHRENKPYLDLQIWETVSEAMSETRSQDEYNKKIKDADIFILLLWTKAGKFSIEEFELAKRIFVSVGKPKIIVYQKKSEHIADSLQSFLDQFQLDSKEYFHGKYDGFSELQVKFHHELDLHFLEHYPPSKTQVEVKDSKFLKLVKIAVKTLLITYFALGVFEFKNGTHNIFYFKEKDQFINFFDSGLFLVFILYFVFSVAAYKVVYFVLLGTIRLLGAIISFKIRRVTQENIAKIQRDGLENGHFYRTFSTILKSPDVSFNRVLQYLENRGVGVKEKEVRSNNLCDFATITLFVAVVFHFKKLHYVSGYALGVMFVVLLIVAFFISFAGLMDLISLKYLEVVAKNQKESI